MFTGPWQRRERADAGAGMRRLSDRAGGGTSDCMFPMYLLDVIIHKSIFTLIFPLNKVIPAFLE